MTRMFFLILALGNILGSVYVAFVTGNYALACYVLLVGFGCAAIAVREADRHE